MKKNRNRTLKRGTKELKNRMLVSYSFQEMKHLEVLFGQRRFSDMERIANEFVKRFPLHSIGWKALGVALLELGRYEDALMPLQKAVQLQPGDSEIYNNLGNLFRNLGRLSEAETNLRHAISLSPSFAEAYNNLGIVLREQGKWLAAEAHYRRALDLKPDYAETLGNLADICRLQYRLSEAEFLYRRFLEINPSEAKVHSNLGSVLQDQGRPTEAAVHYQKALEIQSDLMDTHSNLLFITCSEAKRDPLSYLEAARCYGFAVSQIAQERFSSWQCEAAPSRLRVGIVSGDFNNHPVGFFLEGVLKNLSPAEIDLVAYPTCQNEDNLTARIKPLFSAWKPIAGQSDESAANMIHSDAIQVLLDIAGHTAHNRLPLFALKPAPIQVSWLGYFATTGVPEIDYVIADAVCVPQSHRGHFIESVWYLPDTRLCFTPPNVDFPVTPLPALKNDFITLGCYQSIAKVNDHVLALWGTILAALPRARLRWQCKQFSDFAMVVRADQRLRHYGIDPGRVALVGAMSREAYFATHAEVDMILDSFPYPGGTTTCEALWMGVPTLTLAGDRMLSRQGASLLRAAGLDDWVAISEVDYVEKAIALAGDLHKLAMLRTHLREKVLASPVFDAPRFARNLGEALWGMWRVRIGEGGLWCTRC